MLHAYGKNLVLRNLVLFCCFSFFTFEDEWPSPPNSDSLVPESLNAFPQLQATSWIAMIPLQWDRFCFNAASISVFAVHGSAPMARRVVRRLEELQYLPVRNPHGFVKADNAKFLRGEWDLRNSSRARGISQPRADGMGRAG